VTTAKRIFLGNLESQQETTSLGKRLTPSMDDFPCQNKTLEGTWDHRERLSYVALEMLFGIFINYS
jgi:hypothetical protein